MKNKIYLLPGFLLFFLLASCGVVNELHYSVQGGINSGGITENTNLTELPGDPVQVDAFTGATQPGFNVGMRATKKFEATHLETGIDYMLNSQHLKYNDALNSFSGNRELIVSQMMVPLTWNILFLKKHLPRQEFRIKIGVIGQYNLLKVNDTGQLPNYSVNPVSAGATLGFAVYPVLLSNGNKIGLFVEGYRGSRIYEDFYNRPGFEMPGSSFAKCGISFLF